MILVVGAALAASCCSTSGAGPTSLASCDAQAATIGVGGAVQTGGWAWDGRWSASGEDGGGEAFVTAAAAARVGRHGVIGVNIPLILNMPRVDGAISPSGVLGDATAWAGLEGPVGYGRVMIEVGGGVSTTHGAVAQAGARGLLERAAWRGWAGARGSLAERAPPRLAAELAADRAAWGPTRIGFGVGLDVDAGSRAGVALTLGPSLVLQPAARHQLVFGARAGVPVSGLGANANSTVSITASWYVGRGEARTQEPTT